MNNYYDIAAVMTVNRRPII